MSFSTPFLGTVLKVESGVLLTWQSRKWCLGRLMAGIWVAEFQRGGRSAEEELQRPTQRSRILPDTETRTCRMECVRPARRNYPCSRKRPDQANTWGSEMSEFPSTSVGEERPLNSVEIQEGNTSVSDSTRGNIWPVQICLIRRWKEAAKVLSFSFYLLG